MNYRLIPVLAFAAVLPAPANVEDDWQKLYDAGQQAELAKDYAKAESIYTQAVHQAELFGKNDARVASTEQALGVTLHRDHKLTEAEDALQRASAIYAMTSGNASLDYAQALFDLAGVLMDEGKYQPASQCLSLLLPILDNNLDPNDGKKALALCMQGDAYRLLKRYASAETPLRRCAEIHSENGDVDSAEFGAAANSIAIVYQNLGKYGEADRYFTYAEKIREKVLGLLSPQLAETLEAHAVLLHQLGRDAEAKTREHMAAVIRSHIGRK